MSATRSLPFNERRGCPDGYHKRNSYTSKLGHRVPPRCVRATTVYANRAKNYKRKTLRKQANRIKLYIPSMKTLARKACPPGMIERKGYVRKYSTTVRQRGFTVRRANGRSYRVHPDDKAMTVGPSCVKNTGQPGKGIPKTIGPLRKGELSKHGYSFRIGESSRHDALRLATQEYGPLGVFRKLDAVAKLTKKTVPEAAAIYRKDRDWVEKKFGPLRAF